MPLRSSRIYASVRVAVTVSTLVPASAVREYPKRVSRRSSRGRTRMLLCLLWGQEARTQDTRTRPAMHHVFRGALIIYYIPESKCRPAFIMRRHSAGTRSFMDLELFVNLCLNSFRATINIISIEQRSVLRTCNQLCCRAKIVNK